MLFFSLLDVATMYGSVSQSDGHVRGQVKATSTHLKSTSFFLMYECPKTLSFIAVMVWKAHPHLYILLINTFKSVFVSLFLTTTYLSLSLGYVHFLFLTCLLRDNV